MNIVYIAVGLAVGGLLGYLLTKAKASSRYAALSAQIDSMKSQIEQERLSSERMLSETKSQYESRLESQKTMFEGQIHQRSELYQRQLAELKQQQTEQTERQLQLIKEQMNTASEKILQDRSEQLGEKNKEQLSVILDPLKEGLRQMKEAMEKNDKDHTETMIRLDATLNASMRQSREVGERADRLARALTGENKTQGNFGELRLKQLLEDMGLEEGLQFEEQATMRDADGHAVVDQDGGHRMIPDVILHFPDARDVIIDSKMSFKAFEDYHNAETDEARQEALQRHLASVRQHVVELSRKNYSSYIKEGRGRLDFVLMYVFSESALQLALMNDPQLWKDAYDKGVIITGSQNLYMLLRVLEMSWRQVRQVENQDKIMKAANLVVDRVQLFYDRFAKVDEMLDKTRDAFEDVKKVCDDKGQSIEVAARNLIKCGAQANRKRQHQISAADEDLPALEE